ncbi:hypothetical protein EFB08_21245 [Rufibacter latericius]|uniref:Uncharacterized protein n=1 Tax=Rufibacter latericius TaxID=2487040 RepID=A0A3M9MAQ9_9BACT|nr:hypothetical protein EFB08_21245 [Rufibacter latericius]
MNFKPETQPSITHHEWYTYMPIDVLYEAPDGTIYSFETEPGLDLFELYKSFLGDTCWSISPKQQYYENLEFTLDFPRKALSQI